MARRLAFSIDRSVPQASPPKALREPKSFSINVLRPVAPRLRQSSRPRPRLRKRPLHRRTIMELSRQEVSRGPR